MNKVLQSALPFLAVAACLLSACPCIGATKDSAPLSGILPLLLFSGENYLVDWEKKFNLPPQDANGFSILTPSDDSLLIYVSSSEGDDNTAETYASSDEAIGDDPYHPSGTVHAFSSIAEAIAQTRKGYPDYILLKRGDSWEPSSSSIRLQAGRSAEERMVLTAYGDSSTRPVIRNAGLQLSYASYSAVTGIYFNATQRNPSSSDFVGFATVENLNGFQLLSGYGGTVTGDVLLEDCRFEWFSNNNVQDSVADGGVAPYLTNIILRRNIIANNYSTTSHSQGLFSSNSSVLLEENIFDHNGWYQQGSENATEEGMATIFNHNTYFEESKECIFRHNIFLRSSSIQNKFSSNTSSGINEIKAWDVLVYDNFYAEGEIVLSIYGNEDQDNGPRWRNIHVIDNVATHIGRTHPTGRSLGWGLWISDWDGGYVTGNIFTHWGDTSTLTNTFAISSEGHTTDVDIRDNIIYDVVTSRSLVLFSDAETQASITFSDNIIESITAQTSNMGRLLSTSLSKEANTFSGNSYFSVNDESSWFTINGVTYCPFSTYQDATGDTTSISEQTVFQAPERSLESYLSANGYPEDMDSFAAEVAKQSRFNWRQELTAQKINDYFREGFQLK